MSKRRFQISAPVKKKSVKKSIAPQLGQGVHKTLAMDAEQQDASKAGLVRAALLSVVKNHRELAHEFAERRLKGKTPVPFSLDEGDYDACLALLESTDLGNLTDKDGKKIPVYKHLNSFASYVSTQFFPAADIDDSDDGLGED